MSNLSRDAQELLGVVPPPDGADTDEPKTPAEQKIEERLGAIDTTPPAWRREPPKPPTTVSAETYQTVEAKATAAEAQAAAFQAAWEGQGGSIDAEGNPIPPRGGFPQGAPGFPPAPMQVPAAAMQTPQLDALAESLAEATGADPGATKTALASAFLEVVGPLAQRFMSPLVDNAVRMSKEQIRAADADFPIYEKAYDYWLQEVGGNFKGDPLASDLARRLAIADHLDEITERRGARKTGRVVGRFTETAQPGTEDEPSAPQFSESTLDWAKRNNVSPRQIAEAEKRREVSGRNRQG